MRKLRTAILARATSVRRVLPHRLQDWLTHLPTSAVGSTPQLCRSRGWRHHALGSCGNRAIPAVIGPSPDFARRFREGASVSPGWPRFVAEIPRGRVLGSPCIAIAPGGVVLADVSPHNGVPPEHHRALASSPWARPPRPLPGTTALVGASGRSNYYHWMFDMIPRIGIIREALRDGEIDRWIVPRTRLAVAGELLSACGIDPAKVHWQARGAQVECERLVVSSPPAPHGGPTARSVGFLRAQLGSLVPEPVARPTRRLMLLRRGNRRIANLREVEAVLRSADVEPVTTEAMPLRAQARMFSECSLLVGVHGAGLSNAVFMAPGATLIEVMPPWYLASCYLVLASEAQLKYRAIEARRASGTGGDPHQDVTVDPAELGAQILAAS